jgi:hypothetical protein
VGVCTHPNDFGETIPWCEGTRVCVSVSVSERERERERERVNDRSSTGETLYVEHPSKRRNTQGCITDGERKIDETRSCRTEQLRLRLRGVCVSTHGIAEINTPLIR